MKKKIIAIAFSFCLCVLSACANTGDYAGKDTNSNQNTSNMISVFCLGPDGSVLDDYSGNETIQRIEEKYGITFEFQHPDWSKITESIEKMLETDSCTDLIYVNNSTVNFVNQNIAVKDGFLWDLTDYIEKYMPNYWNLIQSNADLKKMAYNDDRQITGLLVIPYNALDGQVELSSAVAGMMVRKDWLDESGTSIPVTYDDWEKMLTLFKTKYGCKQPLYVTNVVYNMMSPGFSAGFGAIPSMQMNGGKVEYGPATEGWREYIELMHDWYEKGLIGSEYITNDPLGMGEDACISEETGATIGVNVKVEALEKSISNNADFYAVQFPVKQEGDVCQAGDKLKNYDGTKLFISKNVSEERLIRILQMLDDFYSQDMAFEFTYGKEDDTYTYNNGKLELTEKITTKENGYTESTLRDLYLMPINMMLLKDWSFDLISSREDEKEMCQIWDKDGTDMYVPDISLTMDEQETYNYVMSSVSSYVEDMTNRMIVGEIDIGENWQSYIDSLNAMGIKEAINVYQKGYDRYIHR